MVTCIIFFNNLSVVFLNIGSSLNLFKWLVILNRLYLYSGDRSKSFFKQWDKIQTNLYVFLVSVGSLVQFVFMSLDVRTNSQLETIKKIQNDIEQIPSTVNSICFNTILLIMFISGIFIGSLLTHKLRQFNKDEYSKHSRSIIESIIVISIAILSMVACQVIRIYYQDKLIDL